MSPDSCSAVLSAGANLIVNSMSPDTLVRLAAIARERNVQLTIRGAMAPESMVRIAAAGKKNVTFDVSGD